MTIGNTGCITTTGTVEGSLGLSTDGILYGGVGLYIISLDVPYVGDDGGWPVVATGVFPTWVGMYVTIVVPYYDAPGTKNYRAFSGAQTYGFECWSKDGTTLAFTVPPLPISPPRPSTPLPFNPFDVMVETTDGLLSSTAEDILTVVHRTYTTNSYKLRSSYPPPLDVGVRSPDGEDFGG